MQFVIFCLSLSLCPLPSPPFSFYQEIMTSIRFNIELMKMQGDAPNGWGVEEEEEICRWASVKCLHMSGSERLLGERPSQFEARELPGLPDSSPWTDKAAQINNRDRDSLDYPTTHTYTSWPRLSVWLKVILSLTLTFSLGISSLFITHGKSEGLKEWVVETVASCFRPSEHVSML